MTVLDLEQIKARLEPFLQELLKLAGFHLKFSLRAGLSGSQDPALESPEVVVEFSGPDQDLLLERGGELLGALEYLAVRYLRLPGEEAGRLAFDCQDFKMLRVEELRLTALTAAERVERTGTPIALNPMNAKERRVVHFALKDRPSVRTESRGFGPTRQVVIYPAQNNGA